MSTVYAATRDDGQRHALKILRREHAGDPMLRDRFLREARIAEAILHPACVHIEATGVTPRASRYW